MQVSCVSPHQLTGRVCGTRTQWVSEAWCVIRMGERDFAPRWRWTWAERPASRTCARWLSRNGRFCSELVLSRGFSLEEAPYLCPLAQKDTRQVLRGSEYSWDFGTLSPDQLDYQPRVFLQPILEVAQPTTACTRGVPNCSGEQWKKSVMKVWMIRNQSIQRAEMWHFVRRRMSL